MKVTADTITDEQIRELRDESTGNQDRSRNDYETFTTCKIALGEHLGYSEHYQHRQRARCAEIWNARHATGPT